IDPKLYDIVNDMKEGQVSDVISTENPRTNRKFFKLIKLTAFYPAHKANYAKDYTKIKNLALEKKKMKAVKKWQNENIKKTYIKISDNYKGCDFTADWIKN